MCAAEQELMEQLLGVPVTRTGHILGGCSTCEYTAGVPAAPLALTPSSAGPPAPSLEASHDRGPLGRSGRRAPTDRNPTCTCASHADARQEQA